MHTDYTDNTDFKLHDLIYEDLTFVIRGVLYSTHNELGPYAREKQYGDVAERIFKEKGMKCLREVKIGDSGNTMDLVVEDKVALEFKAKRILTKEDYYQTQRYLQESGLKLALLVNFRDKYIKPKRIVRIENWEKRDQYYPYHPH